MAVCKVDCLDNLGCPEIKQVIDGAVFAPFVEIRIGGGYLLTVGNESAPPNNQATISSFEYGFSPGSIGWGAKFEVIDQGGTMYKQIIKAMNKTVSEMTKETLQTTFDFGWIINDCMGNKNVIRASQKSGKQLTGTITKVDQTFDQGKIKLKFDIKGPGDRIADVRHDDTQGDEDDKISLRSALTQLFTETKPVFNNIQFLNKDGGPLEFKVGGTEGPTGKWPIQQQHSLAAARTWLNTIQTINDRGILILYDPDTADIIFQEDPVENNNCCSMSYGTYIVNGGNCTPVISFNPSITWPIGGSTPDSGAASGGASGGNNGEDVQVKPTIEIQKAGTQSSPSPQEHEILWRTPEELAREAAEGFAVQLEANARIEQPLGGWEAELKIQGDPGIADPIDMVGRSVAIVVINPFYLNNQCEWITTSNCSTILSNKRYMIKGCNHQIQAGSFVTTLNVTLATPNKDIPWDEVLGGCGEEAFTESPGESKPTDANE